MKPKNDETDTTTNPPNGKGLGAAACYAKNYGDPELESDYQEILEQIQKSIDDAVHGGKKPTRLYLGAWETYIIGAYLSPMKNCPDMHDLRRGDAIFNGLVVYGVMRDKHVFIA